MENNENKSEFSGFTDLNTQNYLQEEKEPSFMDVVVGIFSEPMATFEKLKKFPLKTSTWLYPVLIFIVFAIISNIIIMSNPEIKAELVLQQKQQVEKRFEKMVKEGKMTQEQADKALEQTENMMNFMSGTFGIIISVVSIITMAFAALLIVSGVYWLVWVKILQGSGKYKDAIFVNGLVYLISTVEVILMVIFSLLMTKWFRELGVGAFLDMEEGLVKSLLSKLNPLTFWALYIVGVGMGTMFNVEKKKSLIATFTLWITYVIVSIGISEFYSKIFG